jgi:hypothetical protein
MSVLPQLLISASAAIVLTLGTIHLVYTFASSKLLPRDPSVAEHMKRVTLVISKQTTVWNAWIGFNASHSLGLMLFGATYGYLAIFQLELLLSATILLLIGAIFLLSFVVLAKRYWFNIPLAGVATALVLYVVGVAVALA